MSLTLRFMSLVDSIVNIFIKFYDKKSFQINNIFFIGLETQNSVSMNIEPGLFEWLSWYPSGVPDWMTESELIASGFNIEKNYKPIIKKDELENTKENLEDFYKRGYHVISEILSKIDETGKIIFWKK